MYLALGTAHDTNDAAAAGWAGDRLRVYRHASAPSAVVWRMEWDTDADAEQAERAAIHGLSLIPADARGRFLVLRRGRALLVLRDVPESLHAGIRALTLEAPR